MRSNNIPISFNKSIFGILVSISIGKRLDWYEIKPGLPITKIHDKNIYLLHEDIILPDQIKFAISPKSLAQYHNTKIVRFLEQ